MDVFLQAGGGFQAEHLLKSTLTTLDTGSSTKLKQKGAGESTYGCDGWLYASQGQHLRLHFARASVMS